MPQLTVVIDYQACDPSFCPEGICAAAQGCERMVLRQDKPGEPPEITPSLCRGCVDCLPLCPKDALRKMD